MPLWRPWKSKPPQGTRINPAHHLADGLIGAWAINEGAGATLYNAVGEGARYNGVFQTGTAAPTWGSGIRTSAIKCVGSNSQYINCGVITELNGASQASMFCLGGGRGSGQIWTCGRQLNSNVSGLQINFYTDGNIYISAQNSGNAYAEYAGLASTTDFSFGFTFDGTNATANNRVSSYLNGNFLGTVGSGGGGFPATLASGTTSGYSFTIGGDSTNSRYQTGRTDLVMLWAGRALQQADYLELQDNPWQLWMPPTAYWFMRHSSGVFGSGAITLGALTPAGTGTFSDIGAGAITLGSLTPAGTGTFATLGSGSIVLAALTPAGTGSFATIGSGAITLGALSPVGTGSFTVTGSGSIALAGLGVAGAGIFGNLGTGAITLARLSPAGVGTFTASTALVAFVDPFAVAQDHASEDATFGAGIDQFAVAQDAPKEDTEFGAGIDPFAASH